MGVGPAHSATDVQTDVQNVPVDTFNGTLKLRLSLMSVQWWCIGKAQNYFSAAPNNSPSSIETY